MRTTFALLTAVLLAGCPAKSLDDAKQVYAKAYDTAFRSLGTLGLAGSMARVKALGDAGKPFEVELSELGRRQNDVNDQIVKAVELKKQAVEAQKVEQLEEATKLLRDADSKASALARDIKTFNGKLTAAGSPEPKAEPERDPNARD